MRGSNVLSVASDQFIFIRAQVDIGLIEQINMMNVLYNIAKFAAVLAFGILFGWANIDQNHIVRAGFQVSLYYICLATLERAFIYPEVCRCLAGRCQS